MNKTLHIVSGMNAAGTMKLCFQTYELNDDILSFETGLTYGPIFRDFSDEELKKRSKYIDEFYSEPFFYPDTYKGLHNFIKYDFSIYDKIVVWHGKNVDEMILLYMVSALINVDIYEADITELYDLFSRLKSGGFPLALGHCSPDNMRIMYDKIKPIPCELKQQYALEWDKWSKSDSELRILGDNNTILEVGEDYFDEFILSKCSDEYTSAARVIGHCFAYSGQLIGDTFLFKRVIHLVKINRLTVCASDLFMNEMEISSKYNKNAIIVNGINMTCIRYVCVKLSIPSR